MVNEKRVMKLNSLPDKSGPVVYWMSRDQRIYDNWALLYAQQKALELHQPLLIAFSIVPGYSDASFRHYDFMIKGLRECEKEAAKLNIPFYVLSGYPESALSHFLEVSNAGALITDFDPLRIKREWTQKVTDKARCSMYTVDAHNIVPVWEASGKAEFGAYTIRPKIKKKLSEFLEEFPETVKMQASPSAENNWEDIYASLKMDRTQPAADWIRPGPDSAHAALEYFLNNRLPLFATMRNDPNADAQSGLSPYFHFGQLSPQRAALNAQLFRDNTEALEAFLEELIIRRELSDNFCFYNPNYDNFQGFPDWAKKSLNEHRNDKREFIYTCRQFEEAATHDGLWNAAQTEMMTTGKMHGYMRMYWAKKILEWSPSPEEAIKTALYLNNKYELDGRDPNGYAGIAWSIGGVHDRAWGERPVFGKIRYMNFNGCKSKFDVKKYISKYLK